MHPKNLVGQKNQKQHESATTETPINQNVDPNQTSGSRRKTRRRSTKTSNEPNQPTAQRRKINSRKGGGRAGGKGKKCVDEGQVQIEGQKLVGEGKNQDEEQNQENGQEKVDEGMASQVIDEVGEGKSKSRKLSEILDDVEDGINEILRDIQEEEPEFLEGSKGIAIPLDEMTPVELELQYQEGHPDDVEVFADDEVDDVQVDDVQVDDVEVFADDEGDDEGVVAADNHVVDEVQVEAGIEAAVEGVEDRVNNLPNLSTKPMHRKRKPSERILKLKLKKTVYDKDGSGSSATKPVKLD
ncbi:unnamed protein product [Lactuca virosa]|uniref:Uncharacterized protein n=1 Tax=Lactuca virosa TaxID=75947 RepID=A0AAU9MPI1_9ASTR|nr:unnamed protein product [Lactuca virosa]